MNLLKIANGFSFKSIGKALGLRERIGRTDLGVLRVAFMVAALDGEVTDAEYKAFDLLAKKCRGYTPASAAEALDAAMRSAGYLMLLSKRVKDTALVKAFMTEAQAALPDGFAYLSAEDVRRAVVTWIMMGMSDGDYSARERKCIDALRRCFAELKVMRVQQQEEACWMAMSSDVCATGMMLPGDDAVRKIDLVTRDFPARVEKLIRQYGDTATASRELQKLIKEGK